MHGEDSLTHRIILADTQVIFRTGAARVFDMERDMDVIVQCPDVHQLEAAIRTHPGSIVVFPIKMVPNLPSLLDTVDEAGSKSVLILEQAGDLAAAIVRRANGMVLRSVAGHQLVDCLRRVASGERSVNREEVKKVPLLDRVGARVLQQLTPKELQIVALVTEGGKNKQIAELLGTKEQVIKNYLRNIYDKTGVSDRLELMVFTQHHRTLADAAVRVRQELQLSA
jgi:DNA-binding NarL/FixJ family response regulator